MATGVSRQIASVVMRPELGSLGIVPEGKLKQTHPRESKFLSEQFHLSGDNPKVFSYYRQFFQLRPQGLEEIPSPDP